MSDKSHVVVGIGELLWDLFPEGPKLGGAPANFAYHAGSLGDQGFAVSRLGKDELGDKALQNVKDLGLDEKYVQIDSTHPTGTVKVEVDDKGQPDYTIVKDVAWDFIEWTPGLEELAKRTSCVCFGSLAQRCETSMTSIRRFVTSTPESCVRIFDVNLRQTFFTADLLSDSMKMSRVVKLNDDELPRVCELVGLAGDGEENQARALLKGFELDLVCVTRGANGCLLVSGSGSAEHPGIKCEVADTVGSGDAFTAALAHHVLRGSDLASICEAANRMGSWVASSVGATPDADPAVIAAVSGKGS